MGINIRNKGKAGEYEFIQKFGPIFTAYTDKPCERNLEQTRYGGSDITNTAPFCIEIKRVEDTGNGNKASWWRQVCKAATPEEIPVVGFRPNRAKWRFLIPTALIGLTSGGYMEIDDESFVELVILKFQELYGELPDQGRNELTEPLKDDKMGVQNNVNPPTGDTNSGRLQPSTYTL